MLKFAPCAVDHCGDRSPRLLLTSFDAVDAHGRHLLDSLAQTRRLQTRSGDAALRLPRMRAGSGCILGIPGSTEIAERGLNLIIPDASPTAEACG